MESEKKESAGTEVQTHAERKGYNARPEYSSTRVRSECVGKEFAGSERSRMNPEMMTVLSMRQKEMSYQHLARAATMDTSTLNSNAAAYYAPSAGGVAPVFAVAQSPVASAGSSYFSAKNAMSMARACYSPLSVGQLPQQSVTTNYDQYGFVWLWISEVCARFALQRQTAHLAVCYAQRILRQRLRARDEVAYFMRAYDDIFTVQKELQVLGIVCVFIAAKIEEVHPPKAADFADYTSEHGAVACSSDDIVRYEGQQVVELKWNLHPTTVLSWLLFLLAGDVTDQPAETMGDFMNSSRISPLRQEVFSAAIKLIDASLLDYQSMEFLPSVLAGSAILLADPGLDLVFVAQFLQLDPTLLWECKNWMFVATNGLGDVEGQSVRDSDRWAKVPTEEYLFIQTRVPVPSHLAYGLLCNENTTYDYLSNQMGHPAYDDGYDEYTLSAAASSPSCDAFGCYCNNNGYPCNQYDSSAPNVYHFKYGWQGSDMNYGAPAVQRKLHFT